MSGWEVRKRTRYGLCCTDCGAIFRFSGWKPHPAEVDKYRARAEKTGCRECQNREKVAALPPHHPHHMHNPDWPYPGDQAAPCCALVQIGGVGPFDCAECGEHYPCAGASDE